MTNWQRPVSIVSALVSQASLFSCSTVWWRRSWGNSGESTCAADASDSVITQVPAVKPCFFLWTCSVPWFMSWCQLSFMILLFFAPVSRLEPLCDSGGRLQKEPELSCFKQHLQHQEDLRLLYRLSTTAPPGGVSGLRMRRSVKLSFSRSVVQWLSSG